MSKEIRKNCIILGPLDSYCLFCECCLKTQESVLQHMNTTLHQERFKSTPYFEQYKDDGIRKFKSGYYCEFCSVLVKTKSKIALHIIEDSHINSKAEASLQEVENGVLALNNIFIEDLAWHGVMDSTCLICNDDVADKNDHVKDPSHIFTLIQSKLDCIENSIFRKVDNDFINCLICNIIIKADTLMIHLKNKSHLTQLAKCKKAYNNFIDRTTIKTINSDSKHITDESCEELEKKENAEVSQMEMKIEPCGGKGGNDVSAKDSEGTNELKKETNEEQARGNKNKKKGKRAVETQKVSDGLKTIDDTIKAKCEGNSIKTSVDSGSDSMNQTKSEPHEATEEAQTFAEKHKIKRSSDKHGAYCTVCNITISSSLQRMREHIFKKEHRENFSKIFVVGRQRFHKFVNAYSQVYVFNLNNNFVVLNENICIPYENYLMITSNQNSVRCELCETNVNIYPYELHEQSVRHTILNAGTNVMCSFTGEFIREIRDNLYHCGFCNFLLTWTDLNDHLSSTSHQNKKSLLSLMLLKIT